VADQHDDRRDGAWHGDEHLHQTVAIPKVQWPTTEPDRTAVVPQAGPQAAGPPAAGPHFDYVDRPDGPRPMPPDGAGQPFGGQAPAFPGQPPEFTGPAPEQPPGPAQPGTTLPWRRIALVAAAVLGVFVVLYGVDLLLSRGELPRGVTVAGVAVGGMDRAEAEQRLRREVEPRLTRPVAVRAGDVDADIDPAKAGLALDWGATLDAAGSQPFNPWTRLRSLFSTREVGVVTQADLDSLSREIEALRAKTDREPAEGTIRFEGVTPVPVDPKPGQTLDAARAVDVLTDEWAGGNTVELPVSPKPVKTTAAGVQEALETVAKPAVSGPVTITGEGGQATLTPEVIATVLTFEPSPDGKLNPKLDLAKVTESLKPQLAKTEQPGKDATVALEGGRPVVKPSVDGRGVEWEKTLAPLLDVLKQTGERTIPATYAHQPAKFTTEQANQLGIKEVIGEFTTRGFARDSGVNIRAIAGEVNGALVKPGDTFSLNGHTGPRGIPQGYIEAGIIDRGRPGRAVGGGCSQFATTLYNAAYFAGMTDVEHKEHSYYISRYPEAREATVFEGAIDLKFRNDAPTGALIQTIWTPSDITVRIWGTKHYQIESITGGRSNFTSPNTITIPPGEPCSPTSGAQGFTVSNTRIVRDARTGRELKRNTRTAVYNPLPKVVCSPDPPPPGGG
jgi:vancomycin resistance protein YoaR